MRFFLRCLAYFKNDVPQVLWSLVLIFLATLAGLLQPFPLAILIDSVTPNTKLSTAWQYRLILSLVPDSFLGKVLGLAAVSLGLSVLGGLLTMVQTMANVGVGYRGLMRVRCDLFDKLQQLSLGYHRSQPQGDAIYRLSTDTYGFQTILNVVVGSILVSSVMLVVMTWIMFWMNWRLALMSVIVVQLLLFVHQWSQRRLTDRWKKAKEVDADLTTSIQRSIASIWLTQAFGREADETARFQTFVGRSVRSMLRVHWQEVLYGLAVTSVLGLGTALIFAVGGYLVWRDQFQHQLGEQGMTVGKLYLFLSYVSQFYGPLNRITGSGASLAGGAAGARRVFEVLDQDPDIADAPGAIRLPRQPRTLELRDVSFAYESAKDEPVLRGISVTIKPGRMVAFVGSSGVGKSTLLNLLPRFYDPTAGKLLLDGYDLRKLRVRDLRKHIAIVLQDAGLLPTTVAENIAYGRPEATEAQIQRAAGMAGAATFIEGLSEKYDTQVSENASNLSGGQRQRIAIARALLTEAPILILDEPTSSLDPHNEQMVTDTLRELKRQRTIIVVSHRLSTVADADEIYVMEAGRIIERGTHDELIAKRGEYYRMAKHQLKLPDEPALV